MHGSKLAALTEITIRHPSKKIRGRASLQVLFLRAGRLCVGINKG
jgi:hypothetical protein